VREYAEAPNQTQTNNSQLRGTALTPVLTQPEPPLVGPPFDEANYINGALSQDTVGPAVALQAGGATATRS
jgi:hypothetical protein